VASSFKIMMKRVIVGLLLFALANLALAQSDPLPSWNEDAN